MYQEVITTCPAPGIKPESSCGPCSCEKDEDSSSDGGVSNPASTTTSSQMIPKGDPIPPAPAGCTVKVIDHCGTTRLGIQLVQSNNAGGVDEDYTNYHNTAGCIRLPLKSGSFLDFTYNQFPGQGASEMALPMRTDASDIWQPAGRGGMFSFLPFFGINDDGTQRRMFSGKGSFIFSNASPGAGAWTLAPATIPLYGTQETAANGNEFTVWNENTNAYFVYGGWDGATKHNLYGRILRVVDRNANSLEYWYDSTTRLATNITGSNLPNVSVYFGYDAAATPPAACIRRVYLQDNIAPSQSRSIYFEYEDTTSIYFSFMTKIINPSGCTRTYLLADADSSEPAAPTQYRYWTTALLREMDADGYTTYFEYATDSGNYATMPNNNKMRLVKTLEPEGLITYFDYMPGGLTGNRTVLTPLGRQNQDQTYDKTFTGIRASVPTTTQDLNALGHSSYFNYNADNLATAVVSPRWQEGGDFTPFTTYYEYNPELHPTRQERVFNGAATYFGYDEAGQNMLKFVGPRQTAAFSAVTYYTYDANRNQTSTLDALNNLTLLDYTAEGRMTRRQDARGNTTYFNYGSDTGFQNSMVDALNEVTYYGYNGFGDRTQSVAPRWQEAGSFQTFTTYYEYDGRSLQTKMIDPAGDTSFTEYTGRGDVAIQVDPRGLITYFTYSGQRLQTMALTVQPTGTQQTVTRSGYNQFKNLVRTQDARDNTTYFEYDEINRRVKTIDAVNNQTYYGYDAAGNMVKLFDPRGNTSYYQFDPANRRVKMIDAVNNQSYYGYDLADNQVKMVDARGNPTYFEYDNIDRQTVVIDALNQKMYSGYDAVSNIVRSQDMQGNTTYFEYDAANRRTRTIDAVNNVAVTGYDLGSNATRMLDMRGNATYFGFDVLNRQSKMLDAVGSSMYYGYDENSNQTKMLDMRGNPAYFGYDALNRRAKTRDALGNSMYFGYDQNSNQTAMLDPRGNTTYYDYDALNRRSRVLDAVGNRMLMGYDANSNATIMVDARGAITYFEFDAINRRSSVLDSLGNSVSLAYDADSNLTRRMDPRGYSIYFGFDPLGRRNTLLDPVNSSMYFGYDKNSNLVKIRDMRQNSTYFGFDALNRRAKTRDAVGNSMYFGYDQKSNLVKIRDARQNSVYFGFDQLDRRAKTRDALGYSTYFGYDPSSNLTVALDARGFSTYFEYDGINRRTVLIDAMKNQAYFGYDRTSNLVMLFDLRSNASYFEYDAINRRIRSIDPLGNVMTMGYDGNSNMVRSHDPRGNTTYFVYDVLNRLTKVLDPTKGIVTLSYDAASNRTSVKDPLGHIYYYGYDELNRTARLLAPDGGAVYYGYDQNSNRLRETDPLLHTTYYEYDDLNRINNVVDPLGGEMTYAYDHNSNLTRRLDQVNHASYYAYDARNSLVTKFYSDGVTAYYEYDGNVNVTKLVDGWGDHTFAYDGLNRTVRHEFPNAAVFGAVYFGYDEVSNLTKLQYPQGQAACYYGYDASNRLVQLLAPTATTAYFEYDAASNCSRKVLGNGIDVGMAYDASNRLTAIRYNNAGAAVTYFEYARDYKGLVTMVSRPEYNFCVAYNYDANDRLAKEQWFDTTSDGWGNSAWGDDPWGGGNAGAVYAFEYAYDRAGNRTHSYDSRDGAWTYYAYDNDNALTKLGRNATGFGTYFFYDSTGSCTKIVNTAGSTYMEYNAANRVSKVAVLGGDEQAMSYDGNLQRYLIGNDYHIWDGLKLLEIRRITDELIWLFTYGMSPIAGIGDCVEAYEPTGGSKYYLIMDQRGSVVKVLNAAKSVVATVEYNAFGQVLWTTGAWPEDPTYAVPLPFRYQSDYLYLHRPELPGGLSMGVSQTRILLHNTGTFLQRDPLDNQGGLNQYAAFGGEPITQVDSNGELVIFVHGINGQHFEQGWAMDLGLRARWKKTGFSEQAFIHFLYGPAGPIDASFSDTETNIHAAKVLSDLVSLLQKKRREFCNCKKEPIFIYAYSNGTIVTTYALEMGMNVDGVVFGGSALHKSHDMTKAMYHTPWLLNYYSSADDTNIVASVAAPESGGVGQVTRFAYKNPKTTLALALIMPHLAAGAVAVGLGTGVAPGSLLSSGGGAGHYGLQNPTGAPNITNVHVPRVNHYHATLNVALSRTRVTENEVFGIATAFSFEDYTEWNSGYMAYKYYADAFATLEDCLSKNITKITKGATDHVFFDAMPPPFGSGFRDQYIPQPPPRRPSITGFDPNDWVE